MSFIGLIVLVLFTPLFDFLCFIDTGNNSTKILFVKELALLLDWLKRNRYCITKDIGVKQVKVLKYMSAAKG